MNWLVVQGADNNSLFEFTIAEILEMECLFKEARENSLNQHFCQEIATRFSQSANRAGKSIILWEQVQDWFREKLYRSSTKLAPMPVGIQQSADPFLATSNDIPVSPKGKVGIQESAASVLAISNDIPVSPKCKGDAMTDISELAYEAKSARDNAWYDVGSFLTYRVLSSGELEVRIRFAGFGKEDDEWVNVKRHVRERSIPLEAAECHKVKVGDLVLCYQDRLAYSVYCDAHIMGIEQRIHDIRGCRCLFFVRYDDDGSEEQVPLTRLCCRPT
ncbi:unnamed protein product [Rhodiola kirilowii]